MAAEKFCRLGRLKKGDIIKHRKAERKRERKRFKHLTSMFTWHDCSDGFICDADILEEHYRFASRAVKSHRVYAIGHRAFVPYDRQSPEGKAVEKLAQVADCVIYRFYYNGWRQDIAFRLCREKMPELDRTVNEYCASLSK